VIFMWPSNDSSRSNQWYHLMAPSKPYNFCRKRFSLKCLVFARKGVYGWSRTPCIYMLRRLLLLTGTNRRQKKETEKNRKYSRSAGRGWRRSARAAAKRRPYRKSETGRQTRSCTCQFATRRQNDKRGPFSPQAD